MWTGTATTPTFYTTSSRPLPPFPTSHDIMLSRDSSILQTCYLLPPPSTLSLSLQPYTHEADLTTGQKLSFPLLIPTTKFSIFLFALDAYPCLHLHSLHLKHVDLQDHCAVQAFPSLLRKERKKNT